MERPARGLVVVLAAVIVVLGAGCSPPTSAPPTSVGSAVPQLTDAAPPPSTTTTTPEGYVPMDAPVCLGPEGPEPCPIVGSILPDSGFADRAPLEPPVVHHYLDPPAQPDDLTPRTLNDD